MGYPTNVHRYSHNMSLRCAFIAALTRPVRWLLRIATLTVFLLRATHQAFWSLRMPIPPGVYYSDYLLYTLGKLSVYFRTLLLHMAHGRNHTLSPSLVNQI